MQRWLFFHPDSFDVFVTMRRGETGKPHLGNGEHRGKETSSIEGETYACCVDRQKQYVR